MTGLSVMITPAACVPALRTTPSILLAVSIRSRRYGVVWYSLLEFVDFFQSLANVHWFARDIGDQLGHSINFSQRDIHHPANIPDSRARASVPKVMIWATLSSPYFRAAYSIISARRSSRKSRSISGIDIRPGLEIARRSSHVRSDRPG